MKIQGAIETQIETLIRAGEINEESVKELVDSLCYGEAAVVRPYSEHPVVRRIVKAFLKAGNRIEMKMCYENAASLAKFDERILYIEGHAQPIGMITTPVHHAWNCYGGDFYFDLTAELAIPLRGLFPEYVAVKFMDGIQLPVSPTPDIVPYSKTNR